MPTEPAGYAWADGWASLGFCLAVVDEADPAGVLARLVRRPATPVLTQVEAAAWAERASDAHGGYATVVEATVLDGWCVTFEAIGYEATVPGVPESISGGGRRAAVLFRSVNADMQLIWAVDGRVVRSFDPLLYGVPGVGAPLREEAPLTFGIDGPPTSASFTLIESLTGLRLTEPWLDDRSGWVGVGHWPLP